MNKLLILIALILLSLSSNAQVAAPETHNLNIEKSVLHWKGSYTFNISEHLGEIYFKGGTLTTIDKTIIGGSFIIAMDSMTNDDYKLDRGPVEHLMDTDFFDVKKFPEARLVITSIEYFPNTNTHEIFADLTIKGKTNTIKFYGEIDGTMKTLKAHFKIDRTLWGITYNNDVKNKAISDAVEFWANLQF